jgi:TPR repeat protein
MYMTGQGVDKNYKKAYEWYEKAAEQGDAMAQNNLGIMHENGQGVDQSDSDAMRWYGKAAAQGVEEAQGRIDIILKEAAERRHASMRASAPSKSRGGHWPKP